MPKSIGILTIATGEQDWRALAEIASKANWTLTATRTCEEAIKILRKHPRTPIILCNRDLPGLHWKEAMDRLLSSAPDTCLILTSPVNDEYLWNEVLRRGGYDVLTMPFREDAVNRSIHGAWSYWKMRWANPLSRTVRNQFSTK